MNHARKMFKKEAAQKIAEMVTVLTDAELESQAGSDTGTIESSTKFESLLDFYVEKFVEDVLSYCNRRDFPPPLLFTAVEQIQKQFEAQKAAMTPVAISPNAPLSELKMNDTTFKFAVKQIDLSAVFGEELFKSILDKLNLYRKVKSL